MAKKISFLFFVVLLPLVFFWQFFFRGQIPIPTNYMLSWYEPWKNEFTKDGVPILSHKPVIDDAFRHLYPLRVIASEIVKRGELPLWNPYNASGTPLLAIFHPGYMTPFGIFFLLFSPPIAWSFYILLQPIVLGLAMYWYTKKLKFSPKASLFTVIALVLSGFSVARLEYGEFLYVLAGLPLLLGIVEDTRFRLWIPIIVAIMMLSGQPHMIVYSFATYAIYAWVRLPRNYVLEYVALSILGVVMAAIQLLPSIELYSLSTISRQTSEFIFNKFLLPLSHLITIIIPNYFGNQATYNYFGPHDYVETVSYIGTIPVLFALFTLKHLRNNVIIRFFWVLAVLTILTTVQWVGARAFFLLPLPVLSADVPSRVFVLTTFALSILAGFGYTEWEKHSSHIRRCVLGFGILLGAIALVTVFQYRSHLPCPPMIPQCRMISVRTTGIEVTGFIFVSFGILLASRFSIFRWAPSIVVLALGFYNAYKLLPFSPSETVFPEVSVISELKKELGTNRFAAVGTEIRSNLLAIYKLQSTEYFDPLHIKRYAKIVSYVNTGDSEKGLKRSDIQIASDASVSAELAFRRERFWDVTGTALLVCHPEHVLGSICDTGKKDPNTIWQDANWQIINRPTVLPRAYFVSQLIVESDSQKILNGLFQKAIDMRSTAFIEDSILLVNDHPERVGSAEIDSYESHRVSINTITEEDEFLVLSDTYYPGWRAYIDGVETPIYRTNYTFRGLVVPQGSHKVVFRYQPKSLSIGLWLSGISMVVWVGMFFWYNRNR